MSLIHLLKRGRQRRIILERAGLPHILKNYFSSPLSSSSSATTEATDATLSFASSLMILTPCAARPVLRISLTGQRTITPFSVIIIISSLSPTVFKETASPFLAVTLILIIPLPPLLWVLYSLISVLLPKKMK